MNILCICPKCGREEEIPKMMIEDMGSPNCTECDVEMEVKSSITPCPFGQGFL